jgi:hypothetical protein
MARTHSSHDISADHVAFTMEALSAIPGDVELTKLATRASALLDNWGSIDAQSRLLERDVIRASAHVRVADAMLDAALAAFASDLVGVVAGNLQHALYVRFFPVQHDEVIAMGLDSEVPEVTLIVHALDHGAGDVPERLRVHVEPLRAGLRLGNGALASRSDALGELGRHMARVEAWHEAAESTQRSLHTALARIADKRKLPATWADAFFNMR